MTVKLHSYSRKYIGLSTDTKPVTTSDETIQTGSTFFESDTGRLFRWDAYRWVVDETNSVDPTRDLLLLERLDAILAELKEIKALHYAVADKI